MLKLPARFLMLAFLAVVVAVALPGKPAHAADYSNSNLMDDQVFDNSGSMSESQIQSFLVSKGPCLQNYADVDPTWTGSAWTYTGSASASHIIYKVSQQWGLNPQVIISTLQKEESLITGTACDGWRYNSAMGYGCPDAGSCNPKYVGFTRQVLWGSWQLKFNKERAYGNTAWDGDGDITYVGLMTAGSRKRCDACSLQSFDGYATIDGQSVYMSNGTTASLYTYTPHLGQSFPGIFEGWFGPVLAVTPGTLQMVTISAPDTTPAIGQAINYVVSFTNTLSSPITVDGIGIVGRAGSLTGPNRDFGWRGPVTLQPGTTQQFTFTTTIYDTGTMYAWPAVSYGGRYIQYNNWGQVLTSHLPNLVLSSPLTPSTTSPVAGQNVTFIATIRNDEGQPIQLTTAGIPIRFYGAYNYDTGWISSGTTLAPGATQALSGAITFDKPGPYTTWVSALIAGRYVTLSPTISLTTAKVSPNFILSYTATPDPTPALGEDVAVTYKLKNTLPVPITLDAAGVVGRYDSPYTGPNRDFGWVGPLSFLAGEEKTLPTFTTNISALNNLYAWAAVLYQGHYTHYNAWGFQLVPHMPNLSISTPLTVNAGSPPVLGQSTTVTATVKNNEPHPIKYSAVGVPIRFYGVYNYDAGWQGAGTLAASGQSGDTQALSGTVDFDKHGPYTLWDSILINGRFITIGGQTQLNL